MQKMKKSLSLVAIVGILFATGMVFSNALVKQIKLGTPVAFGDEGEDGDAEKDSIENSQEAAKKQAEDQREASKKQTENQRETTNRQFENQWEAGKKQWENQREASKNEKEEAGDQEESDTNDGQDEAIDMSKEVAKIESEIASLTASDPKASEAFNASLEEIKTLIAQLSTVTDPAQLKVLVKTIDHKIERLDKMMEVAFENDNEQENEADNDSQEDVAKQYGNSVAQFVHTLKAVEESDDGENKGIGQQVKIVAQAQNDSQAKVEGAIKEIDSRSGFVKFLVGPKYGSIAQVQAAIIENNTRIDVLAGLVDNVTDPAVKLVLQDQITSLQQQNIKLQTFVAENENAVSLFGWLAKLFA